MTAVFGDFLRTADEHIAAAAAIREDLPGEAACEVIRELGRLVPTLARYFGDLPLPDEFQAAMTQTLDTRTQALFDARIALRKGVHSLRHGARALDDATIDATHPAVAHLAAAADHLAAGRDLLQTHFTSGPFGRESSSSWAPVVVSEPVTAALISELADYARRLAPWAARVSMTGSKDCGVPTPARLALHTASRCLWIAGAVSEAAQRQHPPSADVLRLLAAIPANIPPPRIPPSGDELIPQLCDGIIVTAERLRQATMAFARQSRWSPAATSDSWRKNALASAIIGHASEFVLRTLAVRARQLRMPDIPAQLSDAADAMQRAWSASRAIANAWDIVSTGTTPRVTTSPATAEFADLVLRTGRLAYNNPRWTPASSDVSLIRIPGDLAPTRKDLKHVLAAIHHAADALGLAAAQDRRTAGTAAGDKRLYVPTRLLPEEWDIPYRYAPAPHSLSRDLLCQYDAVLAANADLIRTMDQLATSLSTPSVLLSASRTIISQPTAHQPVHAYGVRRTAAGVPVEQSGTIAPDQIRWHMSHLANVGITGQPNPTDHPRLQGRAKTVSSAC